MNTYTVIRYVIVALCLGFLFWEIFVNGLVTLGIALFAIAVGLLSINRRWSDYASMPMFLFGFLVEMTYVIDECLKSDTCLERTANRLLGNYMEITFLVLSVLAIAFVSYVAIVYRSASSDG